MGRAIGGSNTSYWIGKNILDFQSAMSMKKTIEKVWNQTTIRETRDFVRIWFLIRSIAFYLNLLRE